MWFFLLIPGGPFGAVRLTLLSLIVFRLLWNLLVCSFGFFYFVCLCLRHLSALFGVLSYWAFQVWAAGPTYTLSLLSIIVSFGFSLWAIVFSSDGVLCVSVDSHTPPFLLSSFSLAEVLGSRWIWLGHVLWSVPMAVTLCIPVFSRLSYFVYTPGCGGWHTFYPGFLLYFDTGHIACVRRASLFWSGACFLLFLPSFPLVLTGCIAAFTSTCPSGWRWVGVWMFGGMWLLLLPEVFLLSVSVSWVCFSGVNFTNTSCLVCLGFWYVLSASRGIYFLRFTGCWWHSYLPFILVVVCRLW